MKLERLLQLCEGNISLKLDPVKRSIITMPFHSNQEVDALLDVMEKYLTDLSVAASDRADVLEWYETYVCQMDSTRNGDDSEYVNGYLDSMMGGA